MQSMHYGWAVHDENRSALSAMSNDMHRACFGAIEYPEEIDPSSWLHIENQQSIGACQGHALMSGCEICWYMATGGDVIQFSNWFGYLGSQQMDGLLGRDVGSTLYGGRKLVMEKGCCPLDVMPYPNPASYPRNPQISQAAWDAAKSNVIKSCLDIKTYEDGYNFMGSGQGPIQIGIIWNNSCTPDRNGVIERYDPLQPGGGHSVLFGGYTRRKDSAGRNYWKLFNSWNLNWGVRGTAEVSPTAVMSMFRNRFTVMQGISDMAAPKPRRPDFAAW